MEREIEPEPTSQEREAIEAALDGERANGAQPAAYRSAWRADGIRENALDAGPGVPAEREA